MANTQLTAAGIINKARTLANDDDAAGNYAVSDDKALVLLNDVINRFAHCFKVQPRYYGASTTGLTFTSGTTTVVTSDSTDYTFDINNIAEAYQTNSATLATVLSNGLPTALPRLTVPDLIAKFDRDNQDAAIVATGPDWQYWAAEKIGAGTDAGGDTWRFWVYPAINRTQYLTLKGVPRMHFNAGGNKYVDLDYTDAVYLSRLLAWEMAVRQKEMDPSFLNAILAPLPKQLREFDYGTAIPSSQSQDNVDWTVD